MLEKGCKGSGDGNEKPRKAIKKAKPEEVTSDKAPNWPEENAEKTPFPFGVKLSLKVEVGKGDGFFDKGVHRGIGEMQKIPIHSSHIPFRAK